MADWVNGTSKLSKNVPDGLVRLIDVFSVEENTEFANLLAKDVTPDTKCYVCGGDLHAASQKLENGETIICAKKALESYKTGVSTSSNAHSADNLCITKDKSSNWKHRSMTMSSAMSCSKQCV